MASTSTSGRGEQAPDPFLVLEPPNKKIKSSLSVKQFDVFINHRGPDVKTSLALQLYNSLQDAGISAYLDFKETELGDDISSTIKNAIFSAKVHIAIFSPGYAESAWCLAELALMFHTKARVIPLFYCVQPSDFRHIKNKVAGAFSKHEKEDRYPNHDIQQWKDCLQNVAGIMGYQIKDQNEDLNKLCCDVVSAVDKEIRKRKIPLQVAKYAVGLEELQNDFHSHCQRNWQMRHKMIGIFGMGGSGKTTLVKDLFNRTHSEFSGSTILFDVRENDVKGALTSLQGKLLNDLFSLKDENFRSIEEGTTHIRDALQKCRAELRFLIVIDDADHQKQLDALVPIDALNPNSLVVVTTRDERLLIQAGIRVRYKMKEMNPEHSRELFCWHAFRRQKCKSGFEILVDRFVEACGGLPLALRVMGAHVSGSDKTYWKLQLDAVKERPHKDIKDTLKISYEALEEDQKQIFMDIACFFIGKEVSTAISIWKASSWRAQHALQTLKDKCLVEIQLSLDSFDMRKSWYEPEPTRVLRMHDHLRDLGREMADNEMSNPCRLWRLTDPLEMQNILMESEGKNFRYFNETARHVRYLLETSKTSNDLQWLELEYNYRQPDIPEWISLQNLHTLRLEYLSPAILWQRDGQVPLKLKELYFYLPWSVPINFNELISLLGMFKHLEILFLELPIKILEWNCFLKCVRELTNLKTLELVNFSMEGEFDLSNREETTDDRFRMRNLEAITLRNGLRISKLSISGQLCPTLKSLKLCIMVDLIEVDLTGVTTLECLMLLRCGKLGEVLVNDVPDLEMFRVKLCLTMRVLPNFGRFSCLKRVYISRCPKLQDISAIERLKKLKRIWIAYCPKLKNIKAIEQLKGLKRIWIEKCKTLQGVICFKELKGLKRIFIGNCPMLHNIEGIEYLICLESIIITGPGPQSITGIEELKGLKEMIIADSPIISCVERLQILPAEITILVGRSDTSYEDLSFFNADKIGDTLSMADGFCEIDCIHKDWGWGERREVEEKIHSFHRTQLSLSTFIFCAIFQGFTCRRRDICNGIMLDENLYIKTVDISGDRGDWVYTCVVKEEKLLKYDSWMPACNVCDCEMEKAILMGVKAREERKTLHILRSLFAQLRISNSECSEASIYENPEDYMAREDDDVDYDDLVEYVEKDDEYDGSDDD